MASQNVEMKKDGNKLIITIDLTKKLGVSKSGKSMNIASTGGNVSVPGAEEIKIGINCYTSRSE